MLQNLQSYRIVLGSASPRRKELLEGLGIKFEVQTIEVDETYPNYLRGGTNSDVPGRKKGRCI